MAPDRRAVRSLRRSGPHLLAITVVVMIAIATPPTLIVNGLRVVANDWIVDFEYGRDGFPADRYGLSRAERTDLAFVGLDAISPGTRGIDLLREATLPSGEPAFNDREIAHMSDVRDVFRTARRAQLWFFGALAVLATATIRTRWRWIVPAGLLGGAGTTLVLAILAVPVLALGFDSFFVRFHELFFDDATWRFPTSDTLIRLYPERFWVDVSQIVAGLTLAQAVALGAASWVLVRGARRER